ncbi:MAG: polysaccharide export protein [Candidatus Omnitrophica bacterium]|nr:polysaccharide export protein [Candidatus Omnitrophota bacterium]
MKKIAPQLILCLVMLAVGASSVSSEIQTDAQKEKLAQGYHVGVGDLLQIEVYDEPELTREVRVLTDGNISFPLLGSIKAEGLGVGELEKEVTRLLAEKYLVSPQVTVFVKEFSNVYVFGEVKNPGSFPLYGRMTVFEAITLAGGFLEGANKSRVKVIRHTEGREVTYEADIERLTQKGDTSQDLELRANDRVIVSRSFF